MAKLTGVKTIDMVNGEITKIAYDGVEYAKVEGKTKTGDLILRIERDERWARVGDFFTVKDDSYYVDNEGDYEHFTPDLFNNFRKITADTTPTLEAVAEKVDAIDKRVSALEGADRPEEPLKAGDYIEIDTSEYDIDITEGKAYQVLEDFGRLYFVDDDGDERFAPINDGAYTKVDAPKTSSFENFQKGDKVRLISGGGDFPLRGFKNGETYEVVRNYCERSNGRHIQVLGDIYGYALPEQLEKVTEPAQTIEHNGAEYTLVSRKAQPGDVVVLTKTGGDIFTTGKPYEVLDGVKIQSGMKCDLYKDDLGRTESTVLVYAPAQKLKNGDYAVVLGGEIESLAVGDVVEIIRDSPGRAFDYRTRRVSDGETELFDAEQLRKATDAEVAAAQPKPKTGDIVVITANTNNSKNKVGDIGKVGTETYRDKSVYVHVPGGAEIAIYTKYNEMRLATPAEIERYEDAVKAHEAPKFAEGDYAKALTDGGYEDVEKGAIVKVAAVDGDYGEYNIEAENIDGSDYDYFRPQDLEKLDDKALVFAKAGRKVNEYKKGDVVMTHDSTNGHKDVIGVIDWNQLTDRPAVIARYTDGQEVGLYSHCTPIAFVESRVDRA